MRVVKVVECNKASISECGHCQSDSELDELNINLFSLIGPENLWHIITDEFTLFLHTD